MAACAYGIMVGRTESRAVPAALRSVEAAALAGLAHSACSLAGTALLLRAPTPARGDAAVAEWYLDETNQRTTVLGLNLLIVGTISFVWFVAVIRRRVGDRENRFFGTVFLGSALLLAGSWLLAGMLFATPALSGYLFGVAADASDIALWQAGGVTTASVVATRLEAVFIISTTTVGRLSKAFTRPLVIVGYAVGLTLLLAPLPNTALTFVFPIWVAVVSATMLVRRRLIESATAGSVQPQANSEDVE